MKIGLVVGKSGYYSKVSGKKWVTTKTNRPLIKNQSTLSQVARRTGYQPWTTLNVSSMTNVG